MSPESVATESGVTIESFDGVMENAYGKALPSPIKYSASYEKLLSYDAIPAKELPDHDDILDVVNNARKANARQKAMQAALDAAGIVKPTLETSVDLQVSNIVKSLLAAKNADGSSKYLSKDVAEATARAILGL